MTSRGDDIVGRIKPLVPIGARRRARAAADRIRIRRLELAERGVRPTTVPFGPETQAELARAFAPASPGAIPVVAAPDFPDDDELLPYWSTVRGVVTLLAPHNRPDDKYFDWWRQEVRLRDGSLRQSKDLFAAWLASRHAPVRILEIGVRTGRSLALTLFSHPNPESASVVAVDPFVEMGSPAAVRANLRRLGLDPARVVALVGRSEEILPELARRGHGATFDYVLVDGSHDAADALADLRLVEPLVAPGGYVLFDDIGQESYGLLGVWEEWLAGTSGRFASRVYPQNAAFAVARREGADA